MSSPFDALAGSAIATLQGVFGSTSAFTYSRPLSPKFSAVSAFAITGALNMGGQYAPPEGDMAGELLVRVSDIPLGPQKGDHVVVSHLPGKACDGTFKVQEIVQDKELGWATLQLRLL